MSTLTIDMTNLKKVKSSYNLKGKDTLVIKTTGNSGFISGIDSISASNNTLSIKINGKTVKFTNISEPSTLKIQAYSTETNSIYYEKNSQTFYNEFSKNWIPAKNGTKVVASVFDEDIDVSEGYVPTEKNLAKNIGLNINAGAGDDTIKATEYNDTITGGIGTNNIIYSNSNFGNDIINLTKNEILNITGLDFTGIDVDDRFKQGENKNKNDLIVTSNYGTITIKNYFSKNTGATVNINNDNLAETPLMKQITAEYFYDNTKQKYISKKYTGSALADNIDASGLQQETKSKTQKDGTIIKSGITINSGLGNDIIKGSQFNDTITGGIGTNNIIYSNSNFGNDIINLTKNEILNITGLDFTDIDVDDRFKQGENKNDLVLTTNYGTITLKNYLMKNTGATVYINGEDISKSAALDEIDKEYFLKDNGKLKTSKYTGTALADVVDVSGVNVAAKTTKDKAGNIISQTGLTLNTGLGNDKITGTQFNDTIIGGLGENTIVVKNEEFGTDTVNLTKGEKLTLDLTDYYWTEFNGSFEIQKNDLLVKTDKGTVVLKNFAKSNVVSDDGLVKILLQKETNTDAEISVDLNKDNIFNYINTSKQFVTGKNNTVTFTGTRFSETINTSGIDKPLIIKAGAGVNTIVIDDSNSFDITVAEEKLNAKNIINFKNDIDGSYTFTQNGNNLIISNGTSKLTVNNYYSESTSKVTYSTKKFQVNGTDIESAELFAKGTYVIGGSGTINGDDNKNTIIANDYDSSVKASNDTITGGKGADTINAGRGKNTIKFNVGDGDDTIYAGSGGDGISGGYGDDVIYGGDGDDDLYGGDGLSDSDIIYGGKGNDTISALGSSKIFGGEGNDVITMTTGRRLAPSNLYVDGGEGDDTYILGLNQATSGRGYDTIVASKGNDVIKLAEFNGANYAKNGNDLIFMPINGVNDSYYAFTLKDYYSGGFKNFKVKTYSDGHGSSLTGEFTMEQFHNYIVNGVDPYTTTGTNGNDMIRSIGKIDGKGGNDFILANSTTSTEANPQVINTGSGNNSVVAQADYTSITGGTGNDEYNLQSRITTLVDNGGNNTIIAAPQGNYEYHSLDITLNGNGNNTITSAENANLSYYKINATGSGKQTIDINSAGQRNLSIFDESTQEYVTKTLKTEITTGSGDDDITLLDGVVNSGAGNDTITVKRNGLATLDGGLGDDNYIVNHNASLYESKIFIDDSDGNSTLTINNTSNEALLTNSDYNIIFNIDSAGNYKNFSYHYEGDNEYTHKHYNIDVENTGCMYVGTSDINYLDVARGFYNHSYSSSGEEPMFDEGGVRVTKEALQTMSNISIDDGSYLNLTQENLAAISQAVAGWLTTNSYADVQAACSLNDTTTAQENFNAIISKINENLTWTQVS